MIRILLAEDSQMVRGALVALLQLENDIYVAAETANGSQVLPLALEHRPDVAVLDVDLPGTDGLSAATRLQEDLPDCRTLIVTGLRTVSVVRRALTARVGGLVLKDAPATDLADAIRRVHTGQRVFDPSLTLEAWDMSDCPLTEREMEVLELMASGDDVEEIAGRLHLSPGTVRNYLTVLVSKLGARNRIDAIRIASESGWL